MYEKEVWDAYINSFKNKLYGLLCEYEKKGEWEKFLDSLLIELDGFDDKHKTINYYELSHNMNQLRFVRYEYFRSKIFKCMNLLSKVK